MLLGDMLLGEVFDIGIIIAIFILVVAGCFILAKQKSIKAKRAVYAVWMTMSLAIALILTFFSLLVWAFTAASFKAYFIASKDSNYRQHTIVIKEIHCVEGNLTIIANDDEMSWTHCEASTYSDMTKISVYDSFSTQVSVGDNVTVVTIDRSWQHEMSAILISISKDGVDYLDGFAQRKAVESWARSVTWEVLLINCLPLAFTVAGYASTVILIVKLVRTKSAKQVKPNEAT